MKLPIKPAVLLLTLMSIALLAVACASDDEVAAEPTEIISTPELSSLTTDDKPVPGSTDGTFVVGEGSEATFTVNEKLSSLPLPNDAVMRTGDITGEIDLSASSASLVIDLHSLKSDSTRRDRYIRDRLFPRQPETTLTVTEFPDIPEEFAEAQSFTSSVIATINVNGVDAEIEFELETRLDPDRLFVLVKGDFTWADFGMIAPTSRSFVVKDDVHVEVLISATPE
jgi:polyisoprenoid-binding protein YceI